MMAALSGALAFLGGGRVLRFVTIPIIALLALTGFHVLVENWKGNLRAEGKRTCDAAWELRIRTEAQAQSANDLNAARSLLESERKTTGELHDKITEMEDELDRLRGDSAGGDERCLSDGVLDRLGKSGPTLNQPRPKQGKAPAS